MKITGDPYDFPIAGDFDPARTALLIIDMQRDFCDLEGYMSLRGEDVGHTRAIIPKIRELRDAAAAAGMTIVHTREGHRPDLSDLPPSKRLITARAGAEIGAGGPLGRLLIRGEPGWDFVDELTPRTGEIVIDKPGTGVFHSTDLHHVLINRRIQNLVLTGVTTAICVNTAAREAADRGFGVLVLEDCCAEPDPDTHAMAVRLLKVEGGYIATVSQSDSLLSALEPSQRTHETTPTEISHD